MPASKQYPIAVDDPILSGLTPREARFVMQLPRDYNVVEAGVRAGYPRSNGWQFFEDLKNRLADRVQLWLSKELKSIGIDTKRIIQEVALLAHYNPGDFFQPGTQTLKSFEELGEAAKCIKGIKETKYGTEVVFYDRLQALELLGKASKAWGGVESFGPAVVVNLNVAGGERKPVVVTEIDGMEVPDGAESS